MSQKDGYNSNWYKEWFGEDYLVVYQHRDDSDAKQLIKLIASNTNISKESKLLDLACGNGRHAYLVSKYTQNVFGLDLSEHLLSEARKKKVVNQSPAFVRADMRYFPFNIKFDIIFSLFTSFGYFEDDAMHLQVAREIQSSLKENGLFVIDYFNPNYVEKTLVARGNRAVGDIEVEEERWISNKRVHKNIIIQRDGKLKTFHESVRMFELEELTSLLNEAGIITKKVFGDYDGSPYNKNSKRMIVFAEKK
ncbi:MAG: class I SAM-dependent methyltransferase [Calditrichaeota bacterium]|nr:MAG: class I SAM-dependent methyltransferase [Calditrichota bacterium]MBL1206751.1 class I SAM-dependent methyltransferase [Calditrichota bacterium]NOG46577.1 class I SAM-dependent methyltransferase [Calditrichota bacterium]